MSSQTDYDFPNHGNQYIAAFAANIIFISFGATIGWISPATPILLSKETPLITGPLTSDQLSWLGAAPAISAIFSTLAVGFITPFLGCKRTTIILTLPAIAFYVLIYFGNTYYHVLIARFISGCAGGIQTTVIIYIADIGNANIRGKLGSFTLFARNIGILISYIFGTILPYHIVPCVFIIIPIVFVVWYSFFPNTPQYHLKKGNFQKAEDALKYYKGIKENTVIERTALKAEFERLKAIASDQVQDEKVHLKDLLNRAALLGLLNGNILGSLSYLTGFVVFSTYAVLIFQGSGAIHVDPYMSSITFAALQMVGNLFTASLSDSWGRKALVIASLFGSAFGMYCFALFCYFRHLGYNITAFEWVPVTSLSFVIFAASAGIVPLMYLCMIEQLPPKIRTVGLTICNMIINVVSFATLKLFPFLMETIGLQGTFIIFAVSCTIGIVYVYIVVKETKGISLEVQIKNVSDNRI